MYKHILIPIDLANTKASEKAVAIARTLARRHGARVSALSVVPTLIETLALSSQASEVRQAAVTVLREATGQDFRYRVDDLCAGEGAAFFVFHWRRRVDACVVFPSGYVE